jgi:chorismate mutase
MRRGVRQTGRATGRAAAFAAAAILAMLAAPVVAEPLAAAVFERIAERLALMEPVAAWKHAHGVAVEDRAREAVVLDEATRQAAAAGLVGATARPFLVAQIEAAKMVQRCWLARWDAGAPPPGPPPNLKTEMRPKLIEIDAALLGALGSALADGVVFDRTRAADFAAAVDLDCLPVPARDAVYEALSGLRRAG